MLPEHNGSVLTACSKLPVSDITAVILAGDRGSRQVDTWYAQQCITPVYFSDTPGAFLNLNTPADINSLEQRLAAPPEQATPTGPGVMS